MENFICRGLSTMNICPWLREKIYVWLYIWIDQNICINISLCWLKQNPSCVKLDMYVIILYISMHIKILLSIYFLMTLLSLLTLLSLDYVCMHACVCEDKKIKK